MKCVTSSGYLRYPHIYDDLLVFAADEDIWLAPADGGRAWRLSADHAQVSYPRFARDGSRVAWTSWRDGNPEVYTADAEGSDAGRLTYWSDPRTRVTGWTRAGEVLAVSAAGQPETYLTWAYALPLEGLPPRRLPFGPVVDLALEETGSALLTGRMNNEIAYWKRYRGGTRGRLWIATDQDPLFTRLLADVDGQFSGPMLIGGRLFFLSDHEGTGNIYSCALDGGGVRRHTDHDGWYARNPATDGLRIVYHVAGDIWILDGPEAPEPRKLDISLGSPAVGRAPRLISAKDHLGALDTDKTGQASVVEVRGTVHWLTHKDGPARALHVDPGARARLPRVLGDTGQVVWVTDATGDDALEIASVADEPETETVRLAQGLLGNVLSLAASPDGNTVASAAHDGRLVAVDVTSGQVTELAVSDNGAIDGLSWSPDSAWLAWSQPGTQPLRRIRMARIPDHEVIDVTDGRFTDTDPVFSLDGLYLAFISRRSFDPVYDAQTFDLSFPFGSRPYLVPLAAQTPLPFGPLPGGRPVGQDPPAPDKDTTEDSAERTEVSVDAEGLPGSRGGRARDRGQVLRAACRQGRAGLAARAGSRRARRGQRQCRGRRAAAGPGAVRPGQARGRRTGRRARLVRRQRRRHPAGDQGSWRPADPAVRAQGGPQLGRIGHRRRVPGQVHRRPGRAVAACFRRSRPLMRRDFWTPDMSGVDWDGVLGAYRPLLDRVRSADDYVDLMWEVVAELGTSHAYIGKANADGPDSWSRGAAAVGLLGADLSRDGSGHWVVDRVLPGESSDPRARSPLQAPGVVVRAGDELIAVDGRPVDPVRGPAPLLAGTVGKPVELTMLAGGTTPQTPPLLLPGGPHPPGPPLGETHPPRPSLGEAPPPRALRRVAVVPLRDERRLRYQDWVIGRRRLVRELGDGRLGYLHIPNMVGEGWADFHRDLHTEMRFDALDHGRARERRRAHFPARGGEAGPPRDRLGPGALDPAGLLP